MSFQKQWFWDPSITPLVYREWEKKAKIQYKDIIFTHRKTYEKNNDYKPSWVVKEIWERWVSFWKSEEFQSHRSRGRRNHRRVEEEGAAEVTHTGGSISASRTFRILVYVLISLNLFIYFINIHRFNNHSWNLFQEQEQQRTPSSCELFLHTYKVRTRDGLQWVNEKADAISVSLTSYLPYFWLAFLVNLKN